MDHGRSDRQAERGTEPAAGLSDRMLAVVVVIAIGAGGLVLSLVVQAAGTLGAHLARLWAGY